MNIRVPSKVLKKQNLTSLRIAGEDSYVAQFGMYHDLHCLVWNLEEQLGFSH